jgi:hypothetical protein
MDIGLVAALAMLAVWAVATFVLNDAPGWIHLLLTVGVFLAIWRIVVRGTPSPRDRADSADRTDRAKHGGTGRH